MNDCILCYFCETRVAFIEDFIPNVRTIQQSEYFVVGRYFMKLFNVEVPEDKRYHQVEEDGRIVADTYCIKCGNLLGWKVIAIVKPSMFIREGVFIIRLSQIDPNNQDEGANEQVPNDEQGGTNE
uniref:Fad NAD binding oxidoreductases n=1 Tax=Solanum tuberosum TaxID=4113 RepID=M1DMT3_SOLTU